MSRRVITTPLSVARLSDPLSDPWLCVPVSRRVCPFEKESSLCEEFCARKVPSVDGFEPERVTMCDRGRASRRVEYESATTARRPSVT